MGRTFWEPVRLMLRGTLQERGLIDADDLDVVKLTDDVGEAVDWILKGMRRDG
jgi:predicted Rossmann-fold nucleotide-binding protein